MKKKIKSIINSFTFKVNRLINKGKLVVIIHQSRSGSTYLGNILNQSKQISYFGELYNNFPKRIFGKGLLSKYLPTPLEILKNLKYIDGSKISFVEVIPWLQLNNHSLSWLYKDQNQFFKQADKLIYLTRQNKLKLIFSLYLANRFGVYHIDKKAEVKNREEKFYFDFSYPISGFDGDLNDLIIFLQEEDKKVTEYLNKSNGLLITYENDINDDVIKNTIGKITNFVGLDDFEFEVLNKKVTKRHIKDYIINYDDLYQYSRDKSWFWMLEDN